MYNRPQCCQLMITINKAAESTVLQAIRGVQTDRQTDAYMAVPFIIDSLGKPRANWSPASPGYVCLSLPTVQLATS